MSAVHTAHDRFKESLVQGRYLPPEVLMRLLDRWSSAISYHVIGHSVEGREIIRMDFGKGEKRVLMWSQMHGNESTTTKAVMDLINFLLSGEAAAEAILNSCTLSIIPMLNPDGAQRYTRVNASEVDLNRDAVSLSQPESRILHETFMNFAPHYCFNLHDQRTIFNVGDTDKPATLSFLSPAADKERSITPARTRSMGIIAGINKRLQKLIPGQVGRYDDTFNRNCVGDTFQTRGIPTILFEAGHFPGDYDREQTRRLVWIALLEALHLISEASYSGFSEASYFGIPENKKLFFDVLLRQAQHLGTGLEDGSAIGILYRETLVGSAVEFHPYIAEVGQLNGKMGHQTYYCDESGTVEALREDPNFSFLFE